MRKGQSAFWFKLIRTLLITYAALWAFSCTMADKLIFMPPMPSYESTAPDLIEFGTPKGENIKAFYHPATAGNPTVLYSHGNAEDIGNSVPLHRSWRDAGWGVLAYDYPGYGHSSGSPGESSSERAIEAAWSFLTVEKSISPAEIIVIGRSIGSGPSVWLSSKKQPAGLVLVSPFTSTFAVRSPAQHLLPGNRFPNLKRIRRIDTPLLIIHGERDRIIPSSHGRSIYQASPAELKRFVPVAHAGHNDLSREDILKPIATFVGEVRETPR